MNSPKRKKKNRIKKLFNFINRGGHLLMAVYFAIFNMIPQKTYALSGGPSQPEVQSFEPVGTSEMVDLFSGDFVYNIPLLDVGGYPINLSYHSGVSMDQEASWVGLGWNINPGTINRGLRGIPDDFNGDLIEHELNINPSTTWGVNAGVDFELYGLKGIGLTAGLGIKYNNYVGYNTEINSGIGVQKFGLTAGLGVNSSSDEGLTIQASAGLSQSIKGASGGGVGLSSKIGTSFNRRTGLQNLTISHDLSVNTPVVNDSYNVFSSSYNLMQPTYSPQVGMQMHNQMYSGRFKFGAEIWGGDVGVHLSGYYSEQKLRVREWDNAAYGYFNVQSGQDDENATLDFNREKDGGFINETPGLPLANFTYDIYSVTGQGVGGSYRPYRNDIGYVFDPESKASSNSKSYGGEVSLGTYVHVGYDQTVVNSDQISGKWKNKNAAEKLFKYKGETLDDDYEAYYLKEANERSVSANPEFFDEWGGYEPMRINLNQISDFNTQLSSKMENTVGEIVDIPKNHKKKRGKRNQILSFKTRKQVEDGFSVSGLNGNCSTGSTYNAPAHHTAEITTLSTSGNRYVYGLAAYNITQEDVTFSVAKSLNGAIDLVGDYQTGLVQYNTVDNSMSNSRGLDYYYSKTKTPAYAHSYLLTSILSTDYVDNDNSFGPSPGDMGSYTEFKYKKGDLYKWRTPMGENVGYYDEGLKTTPYDDKASYIYGEKELWYLNVVETKNQVAVFQTSSRVDGHGVVDNNGKIGGSSMMLLRKISLYSRMDYENNISDLTYATPIKEVHFKYDYSLCQGVPNNSNLSGLDRGKLTLKEVYFTFGNSRKGENNKYSFDYPEDETDGNFPYNIKSYDRWGGYKENVVDADYKNDHPNIPTAEYPYVNQNETQQNLNANAWNLVSINLPSGAELNIEYESDSYGYVQNKKAMNMLEIVGAGATEDMRSTDIKSIGESIVISTSNSQNMFLYYLLPNGEKPDEYFKDIKNLYFKCLANTFGTPRTDDKYRDYISGYAEIKKYGKCTISGNPQDVYGFIELRPVSLKGGGSSSDEVNPITLATIQFSRIHLPEVWSDVSLSSGSNPFSKTILESLLGTFKGLIDGLKNPNTKLWKDLVGCSIKSKKSWIRVNALKDKLGGGSRVKKVTITDNWNDFTGGANAVYGQEYSYKNSDGTTSGVASYEPQLGGDENPWKTPVYYDLRKLLAPDERMYMEEPFGESFFPNASVGYGRVTVKNLDKTGMKNHTTGKTVHEFYTSKDFPTIVKRTVIDMDRDKTELDLFSFESLFNSKSKDYMTVSQGYSIELNDMNGKPKSISSYQEGQIEPINSINYKYKSTDLSALKETSDADGYRLINNSITVVNPKGEVSTDARIGVEFDMVADFRGQSSSTSSTSWNINVDVIPLILGFPTPIPIFYPVYSSDKVQFRSATTTKVIHRFGLLEKIIAKDQGSEIEKRIIAYDSETGSELITQTVNNFDDEVFNMSFPAYWDNESMGQAFKNIGVELNVPNFISGWSNLSNSDGFFYPGDELELVISSMPDSRVKVWVTDVERNRFKVMSKSGSFYSGVVESVKVLRSGRKNMVGASMASITTFSNPLNSIRSNIYENVIQASAIEYSNKWRTYCECFEGTSTNPYIIGTRSVYKPKASYTYITDRVQNLKEENLNLRKDGIYSGFTPFYKWSNVEWRKDYKNWTFVEEISEFDPYGGQIESKDALGRYATEMYGYNHSVVVASAVNARHSEIGYDGFEDYGLNECEDEHFKFVESFVSSEESHTGKKSIKVSLSAPATLHKQLKLCEFSDCDLKFNFWENVVDEYLYVGILNGIEPFALNSVVISGNPKILPYSNGFSIMIKQVGTFEVRLEFSDKNGCETNRVIKVIDGVFIN